MGRERIVVDSTFDAHPNAAANKIVNHYIVRVDSVMSPVVGYLAEDMVVDRPESNESNLMADILIWAAPKYGEKPVMSVYNMGGIRTSLAKGKVTYGNVQDVAPFENKICFLTLTGEVMLELFRQIAQRGGEGVSHGTNLVISKQGELLDAKIDGKAIDPAAEYRVATIDYLSQGNDGLTAFKKGTQLNSPQEDSNNTRFIIMDYFREKMEKGEAVTSKVEGRIVVK